MVRLFNRIWKRIRQCIGQSDLNQDEIYQPINPTFPSSSHIRSASPNSVADSVSISVRSSGSECSRDSIEEYDDLRKGWNHPRMNSIENPSMTSVDSGYESAAI